MASKNLSTLHDPYDSENQAYGSKEESRNSPLSEGTKVSPNNQPNDLHSVLRYYFGSPTSTHKSYGEPHHSRW